MDVDVEKEIIMVMALMVEEDSQKITSQISIKGVHKEDVVDAVEGMISPMSNAMNVRVWTLFIRVQKQEGESRRRRTSQLCKR